MDSASFWVGLSLHGAGLALFQERLTIAGGYAALLILALVVVACRKRAED